MNKRQMNQNSFAYKHLQGKGWSEGEKHATVPLSSLHSSLQADHDHPQDISTGADFIMLFFIFLVVPSTVVSSTS